MLFYFLTLTGAFVTVAAQKLLLFWFVLGEDTVVENMKKRKR